MNFISSSKQSEQTKWNNAIVSGICLFVFVLDYKVISNVMSFQMLNVLYLNKLITVIKYSNARLFCACGDL